MLSDPGWADYLSDSGDTVNSTGTAAPTGFPTFTISSSASVQAPRTAPYGTARFLSPKDGVRSYLPRDLLRR